MLSALFFALCATVVSADYDLAVNLKQHGLVEFESLFWEIATPGSQQYLQHLTTDQVADLIGATETEIETVRTWLASAGGTNVRVSTLRDSVTATFPVAADTTALRLTANGLPHVDTHPAAVDFVLRRDALLASNIDSIDSAKNATVGASPSEYSIKNIKVFVFALFLSCVHCSNWHALCSRLPTVSLLI
jgi:hypothetical protein